MAGKGVIILSAGGTGGHLFPAEALAHELTARGWSVHLATDERANRYARAFPAEEIHIVPSATLGSKNPIALLKTLWTLWRGVRIARSLYDRLKPKAVIGFGGYPTLPPLFAATRAGLPTMIHEQNAVMGRANKALASRVSVIAGGFLAPEGEGPANTIRVTGNPVRPEVLAAKDVPYAPPGDGKVKLLVFGGSQGAQFFSEALPAAVRLLPDSLRQRLDITQQARPEDEAGVKAAYHDLGVPADVAPFFNDMATRIAGAHLVICRSGASTVSELAAIGRPSILVPYPYALDHDQAANAAALKEQGGAIVVEQKDLQPEDLAKRIESLVADPDKLSAMAEAARRTGKPEATQLLADLAEAIASGKTFGS
ncbi:undecaprenyldiphospho-muramoylpentapeptide beta-N-acetylglucosaminyltransferase [Zhengella mangrovi]|uniref:UDP-N-acetylglucosamine--N-acetylmuramyl-(pentapeptide) pyrophosphoryl-undecaprenol N-acetylglucosamine transferase n=1 Tax=Zhengella mangrovi TaxID=1982044 RepID=A0A2G1QQ50_9HYPH|nr:undecaprenyldiphospho-muramoylpentapeptide beta-N-acetylglucosaminyltransferase [Zhengella mangrovi]PHP67591.1 undecaprenyldiphospho-muramoylpentapeptide beta-N-acetylglucosaminyltransferase [Zhengella mangrovi]